MKAMVPYAVRQIVWMLKSSIQLMLLMSTGILWVQQMIRLYIFAGFVWVFFVPHWWWYLTSPNIIRRVSYRSSQTTKWRNIMGVLEAEGVANLSELVKRQQRLQRQQHIRAARGLSGQPRGGTGGGRRRPPPPPPQLPGMAATWLTSGTGSSVMSPTSAGPYTALSSPSGRRLPPPRRQARQSSIKNNRRPGEGEGAARVANADADSPRQASPFARDSRASAAQCEHPSPLWRAFATSTSSAPPSPRASSDTQMLETLMRESEHFAHVNPADGSLLRSLPRSQPHDTPQQHQQGRPTPTRHVAVPPSSPPQKQQHSSSPPPPRRGAWQFHEGHVHVAEDGDASSAAALCADPQLQSFLQAFPERQGYDPASGRGSGVRQQQQQQRQDDDEASQGSTPPHLDGDEAAAAGQAAEQRRARLPPQRRPAYSPPPPPQRAAAGDNHHNHSGGDWIDMEEEDEEDRLNLHNRATVDIVLPVPLDSLMTSMEYAKRSTKFRRKKFPVVIDVSGGAWIIGSHLWSTMLARVLAARGYVVFCPDYRNFPQTTMEGMTLDVSDAIAWVISNAERYNGDLDNVTLMGQSAGAHLTMMSLISQAHMCAYEAARNLSRDGTGVPPPSDVAYNVPRYNPRQSIRRYVGLSGIYNIERLAPHFHRRGLNTPVLQKIAGGKDQLARYSLHAYFDPRRSGDTGEVLPDNFFDFLPPKMFFLHGDADTAAPVTESASLVGVLRQAQQELTLRRLTRNEENRQHAYRSRGLLPGALASPVHFDPCNFSQRHPEPTEQQQQQQQQDDGSGREEGGEDQRGPRRKHTALSPIVPPSRSDLPLTAVDFEFILIPGATHTDAIIEECIVGHRSCCADFICDYLTDSALSAASPVLPVNLGAGGDWGGGASDVLSPTSAMRTSFPGLQAGSSRAFELSTPTTTTSTTGVGSTGVDVDMVRQRLEKVSRCARAVPLCVPPDGILPMAVPPEDRPRLLNWVTYFCPF